MVRIKDVAREAGVAPSTVSLVMNKKGYVSEETRRKVEAAMKKLHYVPSGVARSLSLNLRRPIPFLVSSLVNWKRRCIMPAIRWCFVARMPKITLNLISWKC